MRLETPASYRIQVQGHIGEGWADRLGGMVITRAFSEKNRPITILIGHLSDQAELSGVLNALYDLHMPLLLVEKLDEKNRPLNQYEEE